MALLLEQRKRLAQQILPSSNGSGAVRNKLKHLPVIVIVSRVLIVLGLMSAVYAYREAYRIFALAQQDTMSIGKELQQQTIAANLAAPRQEQEAHAPVYVDPMVSVVTKAGSADDGAEATYTHLHTTKLDTQEEKHQTLPAPAPACRIDPEMLAGYSQHEFSTFFLRSKRLTNCRQKYPSYSKLILKGGDGDNDDSTTAKRPHIVVDEIDCPEPSLIKSRTKSPTSSSYSYAFLKTPLEGQTIYTKNKNVQVQWRPMMRKPRRSNSTYNSNSKIIVPVEGEEEILMVRRCATEKARIHLRTAVRPEVAKMQQEKRRQFLDQHKPRLLASENATIVYLDYDSVSRAHFRRMLPKTMAVLDAVASRKHNPKAEEDDFELFDFWMHNVIGDNTMPNLGPFLHGWDNNNSKNITAPTNKIMPLFEAMKNAGFVTTYIQDDCHSGLTEPTGHHNLGHHSPNQAWCIAQKEWGYNDLSEDTRCLGDRPSSQVALEYVQSFLKSYQNNSKFLFAHLADGHEESGTVIASADEPLAYFLKSLLEDSAFASSDLLVIVSGDHGMRYGGWRRSMKGFLEHKLPPLYVLAPRKMISNAPEAFDTLRHNTGLLNTKLDLHCTLKDAVSWPNTYQDRGLWNQTEAQSLFKTIPADRRCVDAAIPEQFCSCTPWKKLNTNSTMKTEGSIGNPSAERLAQLFVTSITDMLPFPTSSKQRSALLCSRRLVVDSIEGVMTQDIEPLDFGEWNGTKKLSIRRNIKVTFTTKTIEDSTRNDVNATTRWEAIMNVRAFGASDLSVTLKQGFKEQKGDFGTETFTVRSIDRPSQWPTQCRNHAVAHGVDPKHCVCPASPPNNIGRN
jgi:hypothetical protein